MKSSAVDRCERPIIRHRPPKGPSPHRVTLTWGADAVKNGWLRVTVKANADTGLVQSDVFSFGNLIGETGNGSSPRVSALDLAAARRALNATAPLAHPADFNRDGRVNALDLAAVRSNLNRVLAPPPAAAQPSRATADPATLLLREPDSR